MAENNLKCPKCGTKINIEQEVIVQQIREQIALKTKKDEEQKWLLREKELKSMMEKTIEDEKIKRQEAEQNELKLRKKQQEVADKAKNIDLIVARRVEEQSNLIKEKILENEQEKHEQEIREKDKKIQDLIKAVEEARRKGIQGSMQTQGESVELMLETNLKKCFSNDEIEAVPKGKFGADIIQKVFTSNGEAAGIIAWEAKQTKAWVEDWVSKLKDDGHNIKANLLVLVTNVLPKAIDRFGQYKGIWVSDFPSSMGLAAALRNNLISIYSVALANENSQDKAQLLYKHLTSQTFINRVRTLADTFANMKMAIEKEKRAFENIWSAREMQIERLSSNSNQIFGEIQGIIGGQFSGLEILEELGEAKKLEKTKKPEKLDAQNTQTNLF